MERIAITGASGKIASALVEYYKGQPDVKLLLLSSKELVPLPNENIKAVVASPFDFAAYKAALRAFQPSVIINTVAYTDVDGCETNRALAQQLNAHFPEMLARFARTFDAHLVHYSTDYVFDGTAGPYDEAQLPNPINYYGKSKLAGENAIRALCERFTIIRTNVVYGFGGRAKSDFVEWVVRSCSTNIPIRAATDQFSNPTLSSDIAIATALLVRRRCGGMYHIGGADYCSRYEFACTIARVFDLRQDLIAPVTTNELQQVARRPLRAGLVPLKAEVELGIRFSGIVEGLAFYRRQVRERW
ncbi:MAG: dTDP-4-dehydrorhamnose reductase [Bacteroidota bacterium]|nr:dTDP-4-dehydrorhamnose reductase [Candidatus Kapabacteria bacterium]MCS7302907.1 dTDP-4-dehydrorhamnose reductase [Candidatus Kapabacteria bacterium]MCX7937467.1 dTDP-4-dehydrorhamnose reductase [Chlorobiota bacterium]MDW8075099.1 dTDP-4-dehydrorhamnose reductase [Bacteroidota bacterium]MDW8272012.1 dTDP-4-dehydrorhamnose reductase [Bacteroidota bacterium]